MKLLLGIVSIIAVFTVNGQDLQKEPATGEPGNESDGKDLDFLNGQPIDDKSSELSQNSLDGLELQDYEEDHQLKKKSGDHERKVRRVGCKARNACVVMGGFCVTNATLCSGRLVPEGCKGTNCQCCVPGTIEAMFDTLKKELQSLKVNMNNSNTNLNHEIQSLKVNLNTELQSLKSNMDTDLQSINFNMNNSNSFLNSELQSLKNNMNHSDSLLNLELRSLKNNMDNSDSNLNTELQTLKSNISLSFSNVNSKLENEGCPEGLFLFAPSNQCFKMLNDTLRSWDVANAACHSMGLVLAQPYDPVSIRNYIVTKYGEYTWTWIGARGTGSDVKFLRSSRYIGSNNPLWHSRNTATNHCVLMMTTPGSWKTQGDKLYYSISCTYRYWALCEHVRE